MYKSTLVLVGAEVGVSPGEAVLLRRGDDTIGADGASGEGAGNSAVVVADTEGIVTDADQSTVLVARLAVTRRGGVALGASAGRVASRGRSCVGRGRGRGGSLRSRSSEGSSCLPTLLLGVGVLDLGRGRGRAVGGSAVGRRRSGRRSRLGGARGAVVTIAASGRGVCRIALAALAGGGGLRPVLSTVGSAHRGNVLARFGVQHISLRRGSALTTIDRRQVGNEHGRELLVAGAALDGNGSAVHVELSVTKSVLPSPCQDSVARLDALRNRDLPRVEALGLSIGIADLVRGVEVSLSVRWAAAFDAVDDLPVLGIFGLLRIGLVGNRELA